MSKGNNLQSLFCGILFCISVSALVIACLAFTKKGGGEYYKERLSTPSPIDPCVLEVFGQVIGSCAAQQNCVLAVALMAKAQPGGGNNIWTQFKNYLTASVKTDPGFFNACSIMRRPQENEEGQNMFKSLRIATTQVYNAYVAKADMKAHIAFKKFGDVLARHVPVGIASDPHRDSQWNCILNAAKAAADPKNATDAAAWDAFTKNLQNPNCYMPFQNNTS